MPADTGTWRIFRNQRLRECIGRNTGKLARDHLQGFQKCRHFIGLAQCARGIVVFVAEGHDTAVAQIAVKLKGLERQCRELIDQMTLVRRAQQIGSVEKARRILRAAKQVGGLCSNIRSAFSSRTSHTFDIGANGCNSRMGRMTGSEPSIPPRLTLERPSEQIMAKTSDEHAGSGLDKPDPKTLLEKAKDGLKAVLPKTEAPVGIAGPNGTETPSTD